MKYRIRKHRSLSGEWSVYLKQNSRLIEVGLIERTMLSNFQATYLVDDEVVIGVWRNVADAAFGLVAYDEMIRAEYFVERE